jgi:8-oxo-dGTP pyrophosphatase MutT (NUDIX family)
VIDDAILAAIEARLVRAGALPAARLRPFAVDGVALGVVDDDRAARLARFDCFRVTGEAVALDARLATARARSAAIAEVAAVLRDEGALPAWRDELFAVARDLGDAPVFLIERGAARYFGVVTYAAHVNGVAQAGDAAHVNGVEQFGGQPRMWLARRSPRKAVDPGLLDNLVGGGIGAGFRVEETVVKEAWEEAGIEPALARRSRPAGVLHSRRAMRDGLQREVLFVHDLALPPDFVPVNQDGEAVEHRLVSLAEAGRAIAATGPPDEVTPDASLVVLDYLLRQGVIRPDQPRYRALAGLGRRPL